MKIWVHVVVISENSEGSDWLEGAVVAGAAVAGRIVGFGPTVVMRYSRRVMIGVKG